VTDTTEKINAYTILVRNSAGDNFEDISLEEKKR
jgi:uncharacterized protein YkvS